MSKKSIQEQMKSENPEFFEECQGLAVEQLDGRLAELAKNSESVDEARQNDQALVDAKAAARELGAPYRDAKKAIKLKTKYVLSLIREKGGA